MPVTQSEMNRPILKIIRKDCMKLSMYSHTSIQFFLDSRLSELFEWIECANEIDKEGKGETNGKKFQL